MNERQKIAFHNPCYFTEDLTKSIFERDETLGRLTLRTTFKIMAFFDNELWTAAVFAYDADGRQLGKEDVTPEEQSEIERILTTLLEGVGKDDLSFYANESDFEAVRFLTPREVEKLPKLNVAEVFDVRQRQSYALAHPVAGMDDMLKHNFAKSVDCGGALFQTLLTVSKTGEDFQWHASVSVLGQDKSPLKIYETPAGPGKMRMLVAFDLLKGVGSGQIFTFKPGKDDTVFHAYRKLSPFERKNLPRTSNDQEDLFSILRRARNN